MTDKTKPDLNTLLHLSRRQNRMTVGGGAKTQDITAEIRRMADLDLGDELPQRRHVPGQHHDLNRMLREALTARHDEDVDESRR